MTTQNSQGRISWTREDRAKAKARKEYLFALAIDGTAVGDGSLSYMGVGDKALAEEILDLVKKLVDRGPTTPSDESSPR